ncbi:MAG: MFS transporter [Acidobacteria bacterium]|nr:MFS transporter [Acidobacteriota bacterium]
MRGFTSYQIRVLAILTLINFVNYVDRQIIYPLFPLIEADFHLTYSQLGLLAVAFSVVHSVGTLPFGRLADRVSKKKVISYAVLFWSGATFLSGLATSFRSLLTARALVGVGEAAYTPAGTALITASFPRAIRARVQGVFDVGMFIGGAVGIGLGAILAELWGWRTAFFVVGVPGLLLALSIVRLPEVASPPQEKPVPFRDLLRVPAFLMVLVSGWFITFAAHAYIIWGPTFVQKHKGFGVREAGLFLGGILIAAGILGVMAGAALADRLSRRYTWGRVLTVSVGFLISTPLIFWALHAPTKPVLMGAFFLGCFFMTWYHGPVTAIIHDLTPARAHASAMGIYYFWVNLCATIPAAWLVGKIADKYGLLAGMHTALAAQAAGGLCFLLVIYFICRHGLSHPSLGAYRTEETASSLALSPESVG